MYTDCTHLCICPHLRAEQGRKSQELLVLSIENKSQFKEKGYDSSFVLTILLFIFPQIKM